MTCLSGAQLAAAASGEAAAAIEHAAGCATCTAALARELAARELIRAAPEVALPASRRAAMRAELMATRDALPVVRERSRSWIAAVAAVAAAAATASIFLVARGASDPVARRESPKLAPLASVAPSTSVMPSTLVTRGPGAVPARGSADPTPAPMVPAVEAAHEASPEVVASIDVESNGARFERAGDTVHVTEGALLLNTRGRHATEVVAGTARVAVADAQVRVQVRGGQLVQVQVFAGAAELTAAGRTRIIATGEIWRAPPAPRAEPPAAHAPKAIAPAAVGESPAGRAPKPIAPAAVRESPAGRAPKPIGPAAAGEPPTGRAPKAIATAPLGEPPTGRAPKAIATAPLGEPPTAVRSQSPAVHAFQTGWQALRAGRYADAILAFDGATDAAVVEDARYWAAVAAARAGHRADAQTRLRAFLHDFPASPHADQARAALAR